MPCKQLFLRGEARERVMRGDAPLADAVRATVDQNLNVCLLAKSGAGRLCAMTQ